MATTFSEVWTYIRVLLGDTNSVKLLYSDTVLRDVIRLFIITEDSDDFQEVDDTQVFTATLTSQQKALAIFKSAKLLIAPQDNEFSYKTPVLSVRRKGGVSQLWSYIDNKIRDLEGGAFAVRVDGDIAAMVNHNCDLIDDITSA